MPKFLATSYDPFDFGGIDLGERIKAKRLDLGYTQSFLAEKMGMELPSGQVNIAGWENSSRRPSVEALCRLCIALDCNPNDILGFPLEKKPKRKKRF